MVCLYLQFIPSIFGSSVFVSLPFIFWVFLISGYSFHSFMPFGFIEPRIISITWLNIFLRFVTFLDEVSSGHSERVVFSLWFAVVFLIWFRGWALSVGAVSDHVEQIPNLIVDIVDVVHLHFETSDSGILSASLGNLCLPSTPIFLRFTLFERVVNFPPIQGRPQRILFPVAILIFIIFVGSICLFSTISLSRPFPLIPFITSFFFVFKAAIAVFFGNKGWTFVELAGPRSFMMGWPGKIVTTTGLRTYVGVRPWWLFIWRFAGGCGVFLFEHIKVGDFHDIYY